MKMALRLSVTRLVLLNIRYALVFMQSLFLDLVFDLRRVPFDVHEGSISDYPKMIQLGEYTKEHHERGSCLERGVRHAVGQVCCREKQYPQRDVGNLAYFSRQRAMLAIVRPPRSDTPLC